MLNSGHFLLFFVYFFPVLRCLLFVVGYLLFVIRCLLFVVCCLLFVICFSYFVVCCLLIEPALGVVEGLNAYC